jgi:hypothetical protein
MTQESVHNFSRLGHEIEIIREREGIPGASNFEERLGIRVRYGLKFDGEIIEWSEFVEAFDNEEDAIRLAEVGEERSQKLG